MLNVKLSSVIYILKYRPCPKKHNLKLPPKCYFFSKSASFHQNLFDVGAATVAKWTLSCPFVALLFVGKMAETVQ
jgi:hypothetical protein